MLENITKSNVVTVVGIGVAAAVLSELLPNTRPLIKSAIQLGLDLLTESEAEAEADLIRSLVTATMRGIRDDLSDSASEAESRKAVRHRIDHFKHRARVHARRWGGDQHDQRRRYTRHLARLESALASEKSEIEPSDRRVLDYAFEALSAEA